MIRDIELQTYQDVWGMDNYAEFSPGEKYAPMFDQMLFDFLGINHERGSVLDAGTGSGKGFQALTALGFRVLGCDVTAEGVSKNIVMPFFEACLWDDLLLGVFGFEKLGSSKVDWVYCTDVLEHIPPQFTMLVIHRLLSVARRGVFISVCLQPDSFGAWVGKPLHQTVKPFTWWRDSLMELGRIVEARDLLENAVFLVEPRS